jgi:alpha-ketoglutarate-dependent taurine dioxygenase
MPLPSPVRNAATPMPIPPTVPPVDAVPIPAASLAHKFDWRRAAPLLAMLHALEIPATKGGTMFADMCAAYNALQQTTKDQLAGLVGLHGRTSSVD